jgi:hypothetical protein
MSGDKPLPDTPTKKGKMGEAWKKLSPANFLRQRPTVVNALERREIESQHSHGEAEGMVGSEVGPREREGRTGRGGMTSRATHTPGKRQEEILKDGDDEEITALPPMPKKREVVIDAQSMVLYQYLGMD